MQLGFSHRTDRALASRGFAARVRLAGPPAILLGTEHEYRLVAASEPSSSIDFRTVIHGLALGRRHLDPDDPFAYRLRSGNVITCDAAEAEIVLAPVEAVCGAATRLASVADQELSNLAAAIPAGMDLVGHSTHVSVSVPNDACAAVGRVFTRHFGADLMRLVDSAERCGVWVRPRPNRLELCVDHVDGARSAAVITFVAAATMACLSGVQDPGSADLPPRLLVAARRPRERSGWHLARRSFRGDPFDTAGTAPLALAAGGPPVAAYAHLAMAWAAIRDRAQALATAAELELVDGLVHAPGAGGGDLGAGPLGRPAPSVPAGSGDLAAAYGDALVPRRRDAYSIAAVAMTWGFTVFLVLKDRRGLRSERRAFACVPGRELGQFLRTLDSGALDPIIRAYLSAPPTGRVLGQPEQAAEAGLFDSIGLRRALLPMEPDGVSIARRTEAVVA